MTKKDILDMYLEEEKNSDPIRVKNLRSLISIDFDLEYINEKQSYCTNGLLYDEETDTFDLYPFKVVKDFKNNVVVLIGLRNLGETEWNENFKDKSYNVIFYNLETKKPEVYTGHIPSKEEIESIPENLRAIGDWYWTSTSYSEVSHAWLVTDSGSVDGISVCDSCGVVPYIKVEENNNR